MELKEKNIEMTTAIYNEIIGKIKQLISSYEKQDLHCTNYLLYLANGDSINIKFPKNNIAHLLGINTEYLKYSNRLKPDSNSYDCIKELINDSYQFTRLVNEKKMSYETMFSKNIYEKLDAFYINTHIRIDDIMFIVKYDNERSYQTEEISDVCDYYLARKQGNNYYVLGVVKSEEIDNVYLPVTSRKYDNFKDFDKFISRIAKKQELTYPHLMKNINHMQDSSYSFRCDNKPDLINKVITYSDKYKATAAVAKDYLFSLNKSKEATNASYTNISVLTLLSDSLKSRIPLDDSTIYETIGELEIKDEVKSLIDLCNDIICSNEVSSEANTKYSEICNENSKLKQELLELKQQLSKLTEINKELNDKKANLELENSIYEQQMQVFVDACEKVKKLGENK